MTPMEHLFMQIFDRKAWIESQLRQQNEAYSESLAYNLLADGGRPPPWLWDAGLHDPGCSAQEVLSREQLIQGMLLPRPRAITPLASNNAIYFKPPFTGTYINQRSSLASEICVPNDPIHPENVDVRGTVAHHKVDQVDADMVCSEVVEDSSAFASLDNTQCCRSRQRSTENDSNFGEMRNGDQHAIKVTRSMTSSFMDDHVKELSDNKNSFDLHNQNGDAAAPSRPLDHVDSTSDPSVPSGFISNKATADQKYYMPSILQKTDDPRINFTHNASGGQCCIDTVDNEFISNGFKFIDPGYRTILSADSMLSQNQPLDVTKKLSFDGIDVYALAESAHGSFPPKENFCCSSEACHEKLESVQSLKDHSILKDSLQGSRAINVEKFGHAEASQSAEVGASSSMENERIESQSKLYEKFILLSKKAKKLSSSNAVSHSSPSLMSSPCLNSPDNKSLHYSACPGSPSRRLTEQSKEHQSEPSELNIIAARKPYTSPDVEPMHLSDKIKYSEIDNADATVSEEYISSFQSNEDGDYHMNTKPIFGSPRHNQLHQVDILPAVGSLAKVCSITHHCEKQSDRTTEHLLKDSCKGKLMKKSVSSLDQLTDAQSDKSVPIQDEVFLSTECTEFVIGEIGRMTVSISTLDVPDDEKFPANTGDQVSVSSPIYSDVSRFNGSASHTSNDHLVFLEKECVFDSTIRDVSENISTEKLPNDSKMEDNVSYLIRSSTGAPEDVGPCKENGEKMKDENFEKIVGTIEKIIVRPPSIGTHNHSSEAWCCLRSLNRQDKIHSELNETSNPTEKRSTRAPEDFVPCKENSEKNDENSEKTVETTEKSLVRHPSFGIHNRSSEARYGLRSLNRHDKNHSELNETRNETKKSSTIGPEDLGHCKESSEKKDDDFEKIVEITEKGIVQPPSFGTHNCSSEGRYCLRSLNRHEKTQSKLTETTNATGSKRSRKKIAKACSWPKRRKLNCHSDGIPATTQKVRICQDENSETSKISSKYVPLEEMQTIPSHDFMPTSNADKADLDSISEDHHQSQEQYERKDASCSDAKAQVIDITMPTESTNALSSHDLVNGIPRTSIMNENCNSQSAAFNFGESDTFGGDTNDSLTCKAAKGYCYGLQSIEILAVCGSNKAVTTYDEPVSSNVKDAMVASDEFMPEFEGFNVGISPDSSCPPFREEHISLDVKQGISTDLVTPEFYPSGNYKIDKLPDAYQSLPTGLLEHINLNDSLNFDSDNISYRSQGSDSAFHCDFVERLCDRSTSSGARYRWKSNRPPPSPPVEKFSLRNVSGKCGSSSQTLGTNPELVCFRIDENSSTVEDKENSDRLGTEGTFPRGINIREPLQDVSSIYKNVPIVVPPTETIFDRCSLEFLYGTESNADSSLESPYSSNLGHIDNKENQYLSVNANKGRKVVRSLHNRPSELEVNVLGAERNRSQASIQNGCKPNNIVSNVSSFIPMVQKKQQATTTKGKKDIKVKALEAAEAAKRLEEKKQNEREMRKAAAKLERERLEQEKQVKQKQMEEEKQRKLADVAARKRLREEEKKKEKERKRQEKEAAAAKLEHERLEQEKQTKQKQLEEKRRKEAEIAARKRQREEEEERKEKQKKRCIEEARKLPREQEDKLLEKKEEKHLRLKAAINDGKNKGIVQEAKQTLESEREAVGPRKTDKVEPAAATKVITNFNSTKGTIQDRMSSSKEIEELQSYDISPYKDSDDEDGDEEKIRSMKQIPSWARRESLDKSLLMQQDLDPLEIFSRKSSFSLVEVLYPTVGRRGPL